MTPKRIEINQRQKEFYDRKHKNLATKIWYSLRNGVLNRIRKEVDIEKDIYDLHVRWFGELKKKKVLDLGCYEGNSLSFYLAQQSKEYIGIDLSAKGINSLNERLKDVSGARAIVMDFLSDEFKEGDFDLIYAYGVLHHFRNVPELISKLNEKLSPKGIIVSHDPLATSFPIKVIRSLYRPFQSDREWEWPFSRKTFYTFEENFVIKERRAVLGASKWSIFLNLLPLSRNKRISKARKWHLKDWELSAVSDDHMFRCMHLSMLLQRKQEIKMERMINV